MIQLMYIGAALLGLAALLLIAQAMGWFLAEGRADQYGNRSALINVKPFNCRPCATFWSTVLVLFAALALIGYDRALTQLIVWHMQALIFAFINYFYIKTKIKVYE